MRGSIKTKAIGVFFYDKRLDEDGIIIPCEVRVFPLLVKRLSKTWPELSSAMHNGLSRRRRCL